MRHAAPDIGNTFRGPLICPLAHVRGRCNGINRDDLVDAVRDISDRLVGVHGLKLAFHRLPSLLLIAACRYVNHLLSRGSTYEIGITMDCDENHNSDTESKAPGCCKGANGHYL